METLIKLLYPIYYFIVVYIVALRSLVDELLYKFGYKRSFDIKNDIPKDLTGRVAVVTGGTRGLGMTVVRELAKRGCYVFVASSQTTDKFNQILDKIHSKAPEKDLSSGIKRGSVTLHHLDLTRMDSVKNFAQTFKNLNLSLNYLICNAGIMFAPKTITSDGFESHLAVNYLGHCLLTVELLPKLIKTAKESKIRSRIVNVSSSTHRVSGFDFDDINKEKRYSAEQAYGQSKLAQIMFSAKLAQVLKQKRCNEVQVFSVHPGVVLSDLYEHVSIIKLLPFTVTFIKLITRDIIQGSETTLYAALSSELDDYSGKYLEDCAFKKPSRYSQNTADQEKLWLLTIKLLQKWVQPGQGCQDIFESLPTE